MQLQHSALQGISSLFCYGLLVHKLVNCCLLLAVLEKIFILYLSQMNLSQACYLSIYISKHMVAAIVLFLNTHMPWNNAPFQTMQVKAWNLAIPF